MKRYLLLLPLIYYYTASAQIPTNGLVAYYPLNGTPADLSGNNYNGTVVGPTVDTGVCSLAYRFVNDYIDCGNPSGNVFDITNDASICLWVKLEDTLSGAQYYTVFGKDVSGGSVPKWFLAIAANSVTFHINGPSWGSGYWRYSNLFHFSAGVFYHIVITKSGNTYQFFINTTPYGTLSFPVNVLTVPASVHIGRNELAPVNAVIDEVLLYNRVLSQVEINQIYSACQPVANFSSANTSLCAGACTSFTNSSTNAASYVWNFPGAITTVSNDTNPASICYNNPGQYDVQLIAIHGLTQDTMTISNYITVNPLPQAGTVTGNPDTLCIGSSSQLAVTGAAGNIQWQSSADGISFTDIAGDTSMAYNTNSLNQTTYYRVEASNNCGIDSSQAAMVTVLPLPNIGAILTNADSICAGETYELSLPDTFSPIQWQLAISPGNFTVVGVSDSFTTPPLFQSAEVRVVVSNSFCADTSATINLVVNPAPAPPLLSTNDSLICASDSTLITASGSYSSYNWSNGDNRSYTYAHAAGGYWVTVTDANGCTAISTHRSISVYPVPSVSIVVQGDTLSSFGASSYQWYLNDNVIPNATGPVCIASEAGNYSVEITDSNGCRALSNDIYVVVTGATQLDDAEGLNVYPDPFTNFIYIRENNAGIKIENVELIDVLGKIVMDKEYSSTPGSLFTISLPDLPAGIYSIKIKTTTVDVVRKMIKL